MKKAYIVQWDNQLEYDEYGCVIVCVCLTEKKAQEVVNEISEWVKNLLKSPNISHYKKSDFPYELSDLYYDLADERMPSLTTHEIILAE